MHNGNLDNGNVPETGFMRLPAILRVIPIGKSTWWYWVSIGKAPRGIKLGSRMTAWDVASIRALIDRLNAEAVRSNAETQCQHCVGSCACER